MFRIAFISLLVLIVISQLSAMNATNLAAIFIVVPIALISFSKIYEWVTVKKELMKVLTCVFVGINIFVLTWLTFNFQVNDTGDSLNVQIKASQLINGNFNWHTVMNGGEEYFYDYPNVVIYTIFLSKIMAVGVHLGLSLQITLRIFTLLLVIGTVVTSLLTVWQVNKSVRSIFIASFILLVTPILYFYPNFIIYTDTLTMFLTSLIIYLIVLAISLRSKWMYSLIIIAIIPLFALLYATKANLIILLISVLAVMIMFFGNALLWKKMIPVFIMLVIGIITATVTVPKIQQHYGFDNVAKEEIALPVTHWINMGLNPNPTNISRAGTYNDDDENTSRKAVKEKNKNQINESIKYRIDNLGIGDYFHSFLTNLEYC